MKLNLYCDVMAKKQQLGYKEIEASLALWKTKTIEPAEVGYSILAAFGKNEREITRFKEGKGILKTFDGLLIKGEFCYRPSDTTTLNSTLETLKQDERVLKAQPKIICTSDGETVLAYDLRERETYENLLKRMYCDFAFFYPLMGVERVHYVEESPADVKAAEKLAKLHDELRAYNSFDSDDELHDLNIFITRLLFCFFAEDTGIFAPNLFSDAIERFTKPDGSDLSGYLGQVFNIMDLRLRPEDTPAIVVQFPYVNGGLFSKHIQIPKMGHKARKLILACGDLNWKDINPDIFGSMIQAVVNPDVRAKEGMHYTSVPNIMKVINPLFLDELRTVYNQLEADYKQQQQLLDINGISQSDFLKACKPIVKKCNALLQRMSKMKFLDPACGSGNFLIITYKSLRLLEIDILHLIDRCNFKQRTLEFAEGSHIRISQFYGIELLDFPHEVAMLSLWLAEHQMDNKFFENFGINTQALPLRNITQIYCGNACRMDWNEVCPHNKEEEVFVFGNPPYLGYVLQDNLQKQDMAFVFNDVSDYKKLDYISCWIYKTALFIGDNGSAGLVSTNSICQGEQVSLLWPLVFAQGVHLAFAYKSFKWNNNAKNKAGVTCVVIGLKRNPVKCKIFNGENTEEVGFINPYLTSTKLESIEKTSSSISHFPVLQKGSQPADNGFLILNSFEKEAIENESENAKRFIKPFLGASELIKGEKRYCLWIEDSDALVANEIPQIRTRMENVRSFRLKSTKMSTVEWADKPYAFTERRYKNSPCIIVPSHSSERREYIPINYLDAGTVISNAAFAIYDAPLWLFGILTSRMHMTWVRTVGGRLKTDYRYSAQLCYNTFPFPSITSAQQEEIAVAAEEVLGVREDHPGLTLADLYDPDCMPADLRQAHAELDNLVEQCYPGYPFATDEDRLECLFKLYEKMTR